MVRVAATDGAASRTPAFQTAATCVFACFPLAVLWLYLRSGLLSYTVREDGLELRRPFGRQLVPWDAITAIRWNRLLHIVFIRGAHGTICFSSTDGFPLMTDLLYEIHRRSNCHIPDHLRPLLYGNDDPSSGGTRP